MRTCAARATPSRGVAVSCCVSARCDGRPVATRCASLSSRGFRGKRLAGPGNGCRTFAMAGWVDNRAEVTVPVSLPVVWELWQDKSRIPNWMPWIDSVVPDAADPASSRWILRTNQFGQDFEFSWVARDLPPEERRKISWESTEGLNNRGAVRFAEVPVGDADARSQPPRTKVSIEIAYEVPDPLVPFGAAVSPLVASILAADLRRFSAFAEKVAAALGKKKRTGKKKT